jgi:hypothetical protein
LLLRVGARVEQHMVVEVVLEDTGYLLAEKHLGAVPPQNQQLLLNLEQPIQLLLAAEVLVLLD